MSSPTNIPDPYPNLSAELRAALKQWCAIQEEKYGPDWKAILAKELSARTLISTEEHYKRFILSEENKERLI